MIHLFASEKLLSKGHYCYCADNYSKVLAFTRGDYLFVFNFNPEHSFADYAFVAPEGSWKVILDSDADKYDGFCRNDDSVTHTTLTNRQGKQLLQLYLPARTVLVLKKI
jgi:1,4-alpha-glucan branching enzyme